MSLFLGVGGHGQTQKTGKVGSGDAGVIAAQPVEPDSTGTSSAVGTGPQANGVNPGTIVPRLIKFSGALHDAAGKPVIGAVDVTFSLYSTEAGGDALWFETQSVQADELGRYTALLGAMHTDGLPVDLFTSGEVRWLGIQVGVEAEQQPRVLLVSVPYALKAGDAETLGGKPASAYVLADGQNGTVAGAATISTSGATPAGTKGATDKSGKTNVSPLVAVCSTITSNAGGTANFLPMFTAQCNIENSVITQSGSNVGIGTASPGAQLDVQNPTAQNNIALRATNANGTMMFIPNLSAGAYNGMVQTGDQGLIFYGTVPGAGGFDLAPWSGGGGLRMTSAGNVGIGTAIPTATLEVNGAAQFDKAVTLATSQTLSGPQLDVQTPVNQNTIALRATNAKGTMMFIPNLGAGAYNGLVQAGDQGLIFYGTAPNAGNFVIGPWSGAGSPGMRITAAGNVGIGTTSPAAKLDVNGTANFSGAATFAAGQTVTGNVSTAGQLISTIATGTAPLVVSSTTVVPNLNANMLQGMHAGDFASATGSNVFGADQYMIINNGFLDIGNAGCSSGFVGIGFGNYLSGCTNYSLLGNGVHTMVGRPSGGGIYFREANVDQMAIVTGGNVGIGTTTPGALLDVVAPPAPATVNTGNGVNGRDGLHLTAQNGGNTLDQGVGNGGNGGSISITAGSGGIPGCFGCGNFGVDGTITLTGGGSTGRITLQPGAGIDGETGLPISGYVLIDPSDYGARVGIGTSTPSASLDVVGSIHSSAYITAGWNITAGGCVIAGVTTLGGVCVSDARLKTNIKPFPLILEKLTQIEPVHFNWNKSNPPQYQFGSGRSAGLIAQQVAKVFPEMVSVNKDGFRQVNYSELPYLLLQGLRELKAQNDTLKSEISKQQTDLQQAHDQSTAQTAQIQRLSAEVRQLRQGQIILASLVARVDRLESAKSATRRARNHKPHKAAQSGGEEVARVGF
ncbi:MAG TPA: tail fiber domain-containing protein [Terriglobia bacterium]|nr:tail fiber domain-containing protein [Terriglobia bacterium]